MKKLIRPSEEAIREAILNPNGWVYVIDGTWDKDDDIPPDAIVGVWKVNSKGVIVGDFIHNPNYRPK